MSLGRTTRTHPAACRSAHIRQLQTHESTEEEKTHNNVTRELVPADMRDLEDERAPRVGRRGVEGVQPLGVLAVFLIGGACELLERRAVVARVVELRMHFPTFAFEGDGEACGGSKSVWEFDEERRGIPFSSFGAAIAQRLSRFLCEPAVYVNIRQENR